MIILSCLLFVLSVSASRAEETFSENLHLRPLQDGKLLATFEFTTLMRGPSFASQAHHQARERCRKAHQKHSLPWPQSFNYIQRNTSLSSLWLWGNYCVVMRRQSCT